MTDGWVVLCDVRASKQLKGRERLHARQKALFDELNERHADTLLFPWTAIKGVDEFGCVARNDAWRAMLANLWMVLHPVVFRTAAVYGPVADMGSVRDLRDAHGAAVHAASSRLIDAHREGGFLQIQPRHDRSIDRRDGDMGHLLYQLMHTWTPRQMEYYRLYHPGRTQAEVAERLGVQQATVGAALSRMQARHFRDILQRWIGAGAREEAPAAGGWNDG